MKQVSDKDTKRMTVREVAEVLGVSHDKITRKVSELFPGIMESGKTTYLTEAQVTAVKMAITSQLESVEPTQNCVGQKPKTDLEKEIIIQQALMFQQEKIQRLQTENQELAAAYGREVLDHKSTRNLLEEQKIGTAMYQRIAESTGLVVTDREDMKNLYRRY